MGHCGPNYYIAQTNLKMPYLTNNFNDENKMRSITILINNRKRYKCIMYIITSSRFTNLCEHWMRIVEDPILG